MAGSETPTRVYLGKTPEEVYLLAGAEKVVAAFLAYIGERGAEDGKQLALYLATSAEYVLASEKTS